MKKYLLLVAFAAIFASCEKNESTPETAGKINLTFDAVLGTNDFALNKDFNIAGKTWNFTQLRYWVSNVTLVKANGEAYTVPNSFFLIEENNEAGTNSAFNYPANKRETVALSEIPAGAYTGIKFGVGVTDRYNNNLSLQAGELSQLNGMTNVSWMWATSYIFSSLKGKQTVNGTNKTFVIETGLNANYKTVSLNFPSTLNIGSSKSSTITLNADVLKIADEIDVQATSTIGGATPVAMATVAGNYQTKVFSIKSVN